MEVNVTLTLDDLIAFRMHIRQTAPNARRRNLFGRWGIPLVAFTAGGAFFVILVFFSTVKDRLLGAGMVWALLTFLAAVYALLYPLMGRESVRTECRQIQRRAQKG